MSACRCLVVLILMFAAPWRASAQTAAGQPRWELGGGAGYLAGAALGTAVAALRANSPTPQPYPLFETESALSGGWLGEARVGLRLTRRISVEGQLAYSRPTLESSVRADAEGAAPITVVERIDQYVIDAGVVIRVDELRLGALVPYAAGGAGYLRQLHEGLTVIEQGHVYHLGGGVTRDFFTHARGVIRAAGLRADARVYFMSGGISLNGGAAPQGSFSAGLFLRF